MDKENGLRLCASNRNGVDVIDHMLYSYRGRDENNEHKEKEPLLPNNQQFIASFKLISVS